MRHLRFAICRLRGLRIAMLLALFTFNCSLFISEARAQEAFYIYRNDGLFDGFFFDDIVRMGYSKFDLDSVEHDVYVVQEIETADTLCRIPLAAIDSIGFQQPEIILNDNLYEINGADQIVRSCGYYFTDDEGYTMRWSALRINSNYKDWLPKPGMIIYAKKWADYIESVTKGFGDNRTIDEGPFVAKVVSVTAHEEDNDFYNAWYEVKCEPISGLTDVFEQLITLEQLGTDGSGHARHRMAGLDKVKKRVSGNKDLTLVNLNGRFPFTRGNDNYEASLSLDLSLKVRANVAYNISRKVTYIGVTLKEDAEVGVSFSLKANLEDVTTWYLAGTPVYFPAILPIFQIDPAPGAFIKSTGDLTVSVGTPKFAYHGTQTFHLGTDDVSGSCINEPTKPGDKGNDWSFSVALNGSIQGGANFPMKLETNRWAKKGIHASVGADVFVGPKISASFSVDPVALAKGEIYNSLKGTNVTLAPVCSAYEANAEYSFRNNPPTKTKFFEGEKSFFNMSLLLFPEFEKTTIQKQPVDGSNAPCPVSSTVFPRGNSLPYVVGVAAYNAKNQLVSKTYITADKTLPENDRNYRKEHSYSVFNTYDELPCNDINILDGTYKIVPLINAFGTDVPCWGAEETVSRSLIPYYGSAPKDDDGRKTTGYIVVTGLMSDDKLELEIVRSQTYTHEQKRSWKWIDRGLNKYDLTIDYDRENVTEGSGEAYMEERGPYGGEVNSDYPDGNGVWWKVGPETAGARKLYISNLCYSSYTQSGYQPFYAFQIPDEGCSFQYSMHYEACTCRVKVTRADGRVFYTDEFNFCGYGPKMFGDGSTQDQFMYPPGYAEYYMKFDK